MTEPCGFPDCDEARITFVCASPDHGGRLRTAGELYAQGQHWRFYEAKQADDGSEFLVGRTTPGTNGPRTVEPRCLGCGVATTVTPEQVSLLLSHHMHRVDVRDLARYLTT